MTIWTAFFEAVRVGFDADEHGGIATRAYHESKLKKVKHYKVDFRRTQKNGERSMVAETGMDPSRQSQERRDVLSIPFGLPDPKRRFPGVGLIPTAKTSTREPADKRQD